MADHDGEESEVRVKNTFLEIRSCSSEASRSSLRRCRSDEDILHFWLAPSRSESATGSALSSSFVGGQNSQVGVSNKRFEIQRFYGRHKDSQAASSSKPPETVEPPSEAAVLAAASSKLKEVQKEAGKLPPELQALAPEELLSRIPRNAEGELTSVGSISHENADCSPCIFWFRNNCSKGIHCTYCHFKHEGQKNKRIRPSKKTRMLQRSMAAKDAEGEGGEDSGDDQQVGAGLGQQQAAQQQVPYNPALGPSAPGMQNSMPFPQEQLQGFMPHGQDGWPQSAQTQGLMQDRGAPGPMMGPGRDFEGFVPPRRDMLRSPDVAGQQAFGLPLEAPPSMYRDLEGPGQVGFPRQFPGGALPNMGDAQLGFMRGPERTGPSPLGLGLAPDGASQLGMRQDPDAQLAFARAQQQQQGQGQQGMGRGLEGQMRMGFERMPERGMGRAPDGQQMPMGFERMPERGMGRAFDGQSPIGFERAPERGGGAFGFGSAAEQHANPMGPLRGLERAPPQGYGPLVGEPNQLNAMRMPERPGAQGFARAPGGPVQMDFAQGPEGMQARRAPEGMMGFGRAPEGMMGFGRAHEGSNQQPFGQAMERPPAQGYGQASFDGRPPMDIRRTAEGLPPAGYTRDPYFQNPQGVRHPQEGTAATDFGQAPEGAPPMGFGPPHHDQLQ